MQTSSGITLSFLFDFFINMSFFYTIAFLGALTVDVYNTISGKCKKILVPRILISALFCSILVSSISPLILLKFKKLPFQTFIVIDFIFGGIGFEMVGLFSSLASINTTINNGLESVKDKAETLSEIKQLLHDKKTKNKKKEDDIDTI